MSLRVVPRGHIMTDDRPMIPSGIEITPAMAEAGFSMLSFRYDPDASSRDRREVAREMYLAMIAAKPSNSDD
jgi:hypothetical protein